MSMNGMDHYLDLFCWIHPTNISTNQETANNIHPTNISTNQETANNIHPTNISTNQESAAHIYYFFNLDNISNPMSKITFLDIPGSYNTLSRRRLL
jgi:hypothetical protein